LHADQVIGATGKGGGVVVVVVDDVGGPVVEETASDGPADFPQAAKRSDSEATTASVEMRRPRGRRHRSTGPACHGADDISRHPAPVVARLSLGRPFGAGPRSLQGVRRMNLDRRDDEHGYHDESPDEDSSSPRACHPLGVPDRIFDERIRQHREHE
jgi:hypothetical protein